MGKKLWVLGGIREEQFGSGFGCREGGTWWAGWGE